MRLERCGSAAHFLDAAGAFLGEREAEHNLIFGLAARLADDPLAYGAPPYLALVRGRSSVLAVALRTPPHKLVLSTVADGDACDLFAADLAAEAERLPGVLGPAAAVAAFRESWSRQTGARSRRVMSERIYAAQAVTAPDGVPGRLRPYEESDRSDAVAWLAAFAAEAMPEEGSREQAAALVERRLSARGEGFALWDDGGAVSIAGYGGPTPNGIRIGPVYTPPERRRRGYASALFAELTRGLLEGGRAFCFLFADLANPTSNAIYARIGYRPVADAEEWAFEP